MKSQLKFALLLALGMGVLGASAAAQERQIQIAGNGPAQFATYHSTRTVGLQQVNWQYQRGYGGRGYYAYRAPAYGYGYYAPGYYAAPVHFYPRRGGWYDRYGRWHWR